LKPKNGSVAASPTMVAPHAGAWIETPAIEWPAHCRPVAPHAGAWIETVESVVQAGHRVCRPPCGGVD